MKYPKNITVDIYGTDNDRSESSDLVFESFKNSRWYHPMLSVEPITGYRPMGVLGSNCGPNTESSSVYHDLAHMIDFVNRGEGWRLHYENFAFNVPTEWCIDRYVCEPKTTKMIDAEIRAMGIQNKLMAMDGILDEKIIESSADSLRFMDDFFVKYDTFIYNKQTKKDIENYQESISDDEMIANYNKMVLFMENNPFAVDIVA